MKPYFALAFACLLLLALGHTAAADEEYDELREGEYYSLGAAIEQNGNDIVLGTVWENTAAARAGLREGDRILRINDQRDFRSRNDFNTRYRAQGDEFNGCVLIRYTRGRETRQVLVLLDAAHRAETGWTFRPMQHSAFALYVFEFAAVSASYENEVANHAPRNPTPRQGLDFVGGYFDDWGEALRLMHKQTLPEDLRREHAAMQQTISNAGVAIKALPADQPDRAQRVMASWEERIDDAVNEWAVLVRYYTEARHEDDN